MRISAKSLLLTILILLWFWFININNTIVNAQLEKCNEFWANFKDCGIGDINWIAWTKTADADAWKANLIETVKTAINRVLGILSLITLVLLLRWGFQMVTAAWDETKYKVWFKILKQAAIWLIFIWLSWLIVSMIFRIIALITKP